MIASRKTTQPVAENRDQRESVWGVFLVFLRLGLTSFGGPIAHLGYFRDEFVNRRLSRRRVNCAQMVRNCLASHDPNIQPDAGNP